MSHRLGYFWWMLSFDLRSLESHAVVVDDDLSADDPIWQPEDVKPQGSVHVSGRLSAAGAGRFYWHGRIVGDVVLECSRCLADAGAHVEDEAHVIFAEVGSEETDDPDVYPLDPKAQEIDLRPIIREEWLLVAPAFALCREDCKGLCPKCGADLNAGPHACDQKEADPRWDTLRKLKNQSAK
jgi:uncharacterized protein